MKKTFIIFISLTCAVLIPKTAQAQLKLKVMTYNIHIASPPSIRPEFSYTDLQAIADVLNREKPDLVALQEVDAYTIRSGKESHQAKDLSRLTGMKYHFAGAVERSDGEQGNAILSKYNLLDAESFKLPTPDDSDGETRSLAVVLTQVEDIKLAFMTVHLDHRSDKDRLFQIEELLRQIKKYEKYPIILSGDFNMQPNNEIFKLIQDKFMMVKGEQPLTFSSTNPKVTIDYLLLNKNAIEQFDVLRYYTINEQYASDHLPLVLELQLKSKLPNN